MGDNQSRELPLLRTQWSTFQPGDIFLGDKGFCRDDDLASLKERGVDSVITLARRLPVSKTDAVKVLGKEAHLIQWNKPVRTHAASYAQEESNHLPDSLVLRQINVTVPHPGFRVTTVSLITTWLDAEASPASELADLYFQRWDVELFFRDSNTTMGMDIWRCQTPDMVRKEILMHVLVDNGLRCLMGEAAKEQDVRVRRISLKGRVQALRQWEPHLNQATLSRQERHQVIGRLSESMAGKRVPARPGRSVPRAVKRRPKPYQ
jgi:hypothetical protein